MIPHHLCPFELEIKMADEDEIFRKFRRKTPEWMADFEKPCFSLELETFKSTTNDGEPAPAMETPSTSEISNQGGNRNLCKTFKAFFSRVINLLLTKPARDRTGRTSAFGLFCTDLAALGPYCQDLGPIFSQYGPRAWLIRYIYYLFSDIILFVYFSDISLVSSIMQLNQGQSTGPAGVDVDVMPVWRQGITGKGVVVSILDDGVDHTHPDLRDNFVS